MPKPQTIVVATDFSANAARAVEQAAHLASAWGAKLYLVHVFDDSMWASLKAVYDLPGWAEVDPAKVARSRLAEQAERIATGFAVPVESELLTGRAAQQIGSFALERGAGLLVVGEHGEDWIDQIVLGGTALKVLEEARIPVLLVRGTAPASYRNILAATDFSAAADRAIRFALDCFPDARFALVHAYLVPFESSIRMGGAREEDILKFREREFALAADKLEVAAQAYGSFATSGEIESLALYGGPAEAVLGQVRAGNGDLIVIGKHGGEYVDELLLGSVTQNILYHAECDVLLSA
jgi:nucleotide-binding universal stress UspA family protein